jgi:hypothetical protein
MGDRAGCLSSMSNGCSLILILQIAPEPFFFADCTDSRRKRNFDVNPNRCYGKFCNRRHEEFVRYDSLKLFPAPCFITLHKRMVMLRQDLLESLRLEFTLSRLTEGDVRLLLEHYGLTSIEQINVVQFLVLSHFAAKRRKYGRTIVRQWERFRTHLEPPFH